MKFWPKRYSEDVEPTMKPRFRPAVLLDRSAALERIGGDEELLREIAGLFLAEYPTLMQDIRLALESGDAEALERNAHSLKGSVANFEARPAVEAALTLEAMGRTRNLDRAPTALIELEAVLRALHPELISLSNQ
jgi:two-component system sensor histidine kinase/response regulator